MLTMTSADFIEGFGAIGDFLRRPPRMDASMTCSDGQLVIVTEGMEIGIPVSGHFEGTAWILGAHLHGLTQIAKKLPPQAGARIFIAEGKFHVDRAIVPLRLEAASPPPVILVPKDAPLSFWLGLPHQYTQEEIAGAGLAAKVEEATRARDALIEKAAKLLAPLRVNKSALGAFVDEGLKS